MKKKQYLIIILSITFLFLSYFIYSSNVKQLGLNQDKKTVNQQINNQLSPTNLPTPTLDELKVYKNTAYHFEISYPSSWILDDSFDQDITLTLLDKEGKENLATISIDPTNKFKITIPIEEWIKKTNQIPKEHPAQRDLSIVKDEMMIAGTKPVAVDNGGFGSQGTDYYFVHNSKVYSISKSIFEDDESHINEKACNQIISSFKFTE